MIYNCINHSDVHECSAHLTAILNLGISVGVPVHLSHNAMCIIRRGSGCCAEMRSIIDMIIK